MDLVKFFIYSETSYICGPWEIILRTAYLENPADKIDQKVKRVRAVYMAEVPIYRPGMII